MNLNTESAKVRNGFEVGMVMPDLKIGDTILFDDQEDDAQGSVVTDIFRAKKNTPIIVQFMPEFIPVTNEGMFVYGKKNFRKKLG